jgi:hypothetical protein
MQLLGSCAELSVVAVNWEPAGIQQAAAAATAATAYAKLSL